MTLLKEVEKILSQRHGEYNKSKPFEALGMIGYLCGYYEYQKSNLIEN